ncbi:hypothetical protein HGK75_05275 [uncultured bacterium]|uniref:hypothetical protein n=1 Tax=Acetilactobacillus jinshanensis TaxID=1720083 RepID=UPI00218C0C1C|nr:hypothetical protein HGK75_05275 [uncultured bacterium]
MLSTEAKNGLNYHGVTTHHNWKGETHHNLKHPKHSHKVLTTIIVIVILAIIIVGLAMSAYY